MGRHDRFGLFSQDSWLNQVSLRDSNQICIAIVSCPSAGFPSVFQVLCEIQGHGFFKRAVIPTLLYLQVCVTLSYLFWSVLALFYLIQHSALKSVYENDKLDPGWERTVVFPKTWQDGYGMSGCSYTILWFELVLFPSVPYSSDLFHSPLELR